MSKVPPPDGYEIVPLSEYGPSGTWMSETYLYLDPESVWHAGRRDDPWVWCSVDTFARPINPSTLHENQASIFEWVLSVFGRPTTERAVDRLYEELKELEGEVASHVEDESIDELLEEFADVFICACSVFSAAGRDLQTEVDRKMVVNRARRWVVRGDGTGQHQPEAGGDGS